MKVILFSPPSRAGYLTLFESADNVTAIYKEFCKFDELLSKLVRGSLNKGKFVFNFSFHSACPGSDAVSATGETHTVNSSRKRLWELLSADWLSRASGPISWQRSYNRFLEKEGVDMEMQRRASLLQLWTTQVSAAHRQMGYAPQTGAIPPHPSGMFKFLTQAVNSVFSDKSPVPLCSYISCLITCHDLLLQVELYSI